MKEEELDITIENWHEIPREEKIKILKYLENKNCFITIHTRWINKKG